MPTIESRRPKGSRLVQSFIRFFILLTAFTSFSAFAFEQAIWIGAGDGNWSNPANWNPNLVPNNSPDQDFRVIWNSLPGTLNVDVPVTVLSLTLWGGGTLNVTSDLHFTDGLSWTFGTITGTGTLQTDNGDEILPDGPGHSRILDGFAWNVKHSLVLQASLELANHPDQGRFSHIFVSPGAQFSTLQSDSSLLVSPAGSRSHVDNGGSIRLVSPLSTEADILNHNVLAVEGTTLTLTNADVVQDAGSLTLIQGTILNRSTDSTHGQVLIRGGSLVGNGQIDVGQIGEDGGPSVTVSGNLTFNDLTIRNSATFSVHIGGSTSDQFDHISASEKLSNHSKLQVDLVNGFEHSIRPSDVFEIISSDPNAQVDGAFENAPFGQRIKVGNFGTILVDHPSDNSKSVILRDFQPIQFSLSLNSTASSFYPLPVIEFLVADDCSLTELSTINWTEGTVLFEIATSYVAGQDHLGIKSTGTGPGQISTVRDPADGTQLQVSYQGTQFATATSFLPIGNVTSGSQLLVHLTSNATTEAIRALVQSCIYTNDIYGFDAFTNDLTRIFPNRSIRVTLEEPTGFHAIGEIPVYMPKVLQIACVPNYINITPAISKQITCEAVFDNPQRTESFRVGTQIHYSTGGPFDDCNGLPVTFTPLSQNPSTVVVTYAGGTAEDVGCAVVATVGSFFASACLIVTGSAPGVVHCLLTASDEDASPDCPAIKPPETAQFSRDRLFATSAPNLIALPTFHALENLMDQTAEGRRLTGLYWKHSTECVYICIAQNLFPQVRDVLVRWQASVNALLAGKGAGASIVPSMISSLNLLWDQFLKYGSPELKADLKTERDRFHGFQDFSGKSLAEWSQMLQIPAPTQSTPLAILSKPALVAGQFTAQANYLAGLNYSLLRSADLITWSPTPNVGFKTNSLTLIISDPNPPGGDIYYRLSLGGF